MSVGPDAFVQPSQYPLSGHTEATLPIVSEKRTTRLGGKTAQLNDDSPAPSRHDIYYAVCQPYNWGMRYSVADAKDKNRLNFPVARQFALDLYDVLIEKVQWGGNYFGKGKAALTLSDIHVQDRVLDNLAKLIKPIIENALTTSTSGPFALPVNAVPAIVVTSEDLGSGVKGMFDGQKWKLSLWAGAMAELFKPLDSGTGEMNTAAKKMLQDFVDTIYHETRHCQQYFWVFAMAQQNTDNFPETPNIAKWPSYFAKPTANAAAVIELAAKIKMPEDQIALAGIKAMAAGMYPWTLSIWQARKEYPTFAPDQSALNAEYEKACNQAADILKNVGAGGTPIDINDMVHETSAVG
ncbi:hypothetical protein [Paraburkholderia sp.]|uniref:hypothetical protein n=1 Tax=Paraburkholderia sp. TaxID=1926495 RepID=UPI00286EE3D7|nr:hypothetical protein [Paraburkholderia sp.]